MKLSTTQQSLVDHMRTTNCPLIRLHGGYWTTTDQIPLTGGWDPRLGPWWGTTTVRALERTGVIVNETANPSWRGRYKLTIAQAGTVPPQASASTAENSRTRRAQGSTGQ